MPNTSNKKYLTKDIAINYCIKAKRIKEPQDIGERRALKNKLMMQYIVTELEAINILNGYHIDDYIEKYERLSRNKVAGPKKLEFDRNWNQFLELLDMSGIIEYVDDWDKSY